MSNALLTIDMVTREALRVAHETCQFIGTVDRQYDDSFGKTGAKIGTSLRVRKPNKYVRTQGSRVMDVQDQSEESGSITVATQDHVDMRFNSVELALSIDDFSKRYIEPAVKALVSGIESDFIAYATKQTYNVAGQGASYAVGTALTDLTSFGYARALMNQGLAPKDEMRSLQIDSVTMGGMVNGLKGLFQDSNQIKTQYREGLIGRTAGFNWYENERMWTLTNNSDVTCTVASSAAVTDGGNNITFASLAAAPTVGAVFTIPGVYACHPETKASLGRLQQFVITATSTTILTVSPAFNLTGAKKNICSSTGADLATTFFDSTSLVPVFSGAASTSYINQLAYHKDAFQFVTADLPLMGDADVCVRRVQDGLSMRVWRASDIRNDEMLMRIDILYGMAALRAEWAARIMGAAS